MIVDSSALVAILRNEPDAEALVEAIGRAPAPRLSATTLLETSIVLGPDLQPALDAFVEVSLLDVVPFDREQAVAARVAHRRFGRGSGSAARLNVGDCMVYALAEVTGEPLLFKGDDFTHTDVMPAI